MKPFEIVSSLPQWAKAPPEAIVDSPAFMMPCRLWDETTALKMADVEPARQETLALSVEFGGEPHELLLARSARFPDLDKIWDSRSDVPEPVLLALVEKECGSLFQALENAIRKQMRLAGCLESEGGQPSRLLNLQTATEPAIVFSLTRSDTVVSALGSVRNLDLSHDAIRSQMLPSECEYAAFATSGADLAQLAPGDAMLVPEAGTIPPRLFADGRFFVDSSGVTAAVPDALVHVRSASGIEISLGELFDAAGGNPPELQPAGQGTQLKLVKDGRTVACGRLDRLAGQPAFIVE